MGARSPERKQYYKSKYFITPEETRLKLLSQQDITNNRTAYFERGEKMGNVNGEKRAKTSKGQDARSQSREMLT